MSLTPRVLIEYFATGYGIGANTTPEIYTARARSDLGQVRIAIQISLYFLLVYACPRDCRLGIISWQKILRAIGHGLRKRWSTPKGSYQLITILAEIPRAPMERGQGNNYVDACQSSMYCTYSFADFE